jgi:hypothetical protein
MHNFFLKAKIVQKRYILPQKEKPRAAAPYPVQVQASFASVRFSLKKTKRPVSLPGRCFWFLLVRQCVCGPYIVPFPP